MVSAKTQNNLSPKEKTQDDIQYTISKENKIAARTQKLIIFANQYLQQYNRTLGKVREVGDCFFSAFAQQLNVVKNSVEYHAAILRRECAKHAQQINKTDSSGWLAESLWFKTAVEQDKKTNRSLHYNSWSGYTHKINKMQTALDEKTFAVDGRPDIEGRYFCKHYKVPFHLINIQFLNSDKYQQETPHIDHRFYNNNGSIKNQSKPDYKKNSVVRLVCYANHFAPVILKSERSSQIVTTPQLNTG